MQLTSLNRLNHTDIILDYDKLQIPGSSILSCYIRQHLTIITHHPSDILKATEESNFNKSTFSLNPDKDD